MIAALSLLLSGSAFSADVTEIPPFLRGDIGIGYSVTAIPDRLFEDNQPVGRRRSIDHMMDYSGTFGFAPGFALSLSLPHYASSRIRFFDSQRMVYDPNLGTGTMIDTDPLSADPEIHGIGAGGTWITVAATPFSETTFAPRGDQITWLIRLGYQFKDNTAIWTHNDNGKRGAGPGSPGLLIESFFSTTNGMSQPWIGVSWDKRFPFEADIQDENGKSLATDLTIQSASSVILSTGLSIEALNIPSFADGLGTAIIIDPRVRFGYHSWADVPSGVSLPSVLSISQNSIVTQSETSSLWAGFNFKWRIIRYLDWDTNLDMGTPFARQLEHPYDVTTGMGKLGWEIGTGLTFRMRDPLFDKR
jgi:hypothetical protein